MFNSNIDASVLWTVLLELADDRDKAEHWWRDCEVNENPEQLWAWVKQLVMQWIQEKATKNTEVPVLKRHHTNGNRGPRLTISRDRPSPGARRVGHVPWA